LSVHAGLRIQEPARDSGGDRAEEKLALDVGPGPGGGPLRVTREEIGDAIASLPEREKLVLTLYYYENLTMKQIAEVLDVSPSRISQLHTKAILRLKARLAGSPVAQ
jgi:DNA-directed RNA polymerase specialized sigma24 family protein